MPTPGVGKHDNFFRTNATKFRVSPCDLLWRRKNAKGDHWTSFEAFDEAERSENLRWLRATAYWPYESPRILCVPPFDLTRNFEGSLITTLRFPEAKKGASIDED